MADPRDKRWRYTFKIPCEVVFTTVAPDRWLAYEDAKNLFDDLAEGGLCPKLELREGDWNDVQLLTFPLPVGDSDLPPTAQQEMFRYLVSVAEWRPEEEA